jgi:hypothetical protein
MKDKKNQAKYPDEGFWSSSLNWMSRFKDEKEKASLGRYGQEKF